MIHQLCQDIVGLIRGKDKDGFWSKLKTAKVVNKKPELQNVQRYKGFGLMVLYITGQPNRMLNMLSVLQKHIEDLKNDKLNQYIIPKI